MQKSTGPVAFRSNYDKTSQRCILSLQLMWLLIKNWMCEQNVFQQLNFFLACDLFYLRERVMKIKGNSDEDMFNTLGFFHGSKKTFFDYDHSVFVSFQHESLCWIKPNKNSNVPLVSNLYNVALKADLMITFEIQESHLLNFDNKINRAAATVSYF